MTEDRFEHIVLWALWQLEGLWLKGYVHRTPDSDRITEDGIKKIKELGNPHATDKELAAATYMFRRFTKEEETT